MSKLAKFIVMITYLVIISPSTGIYAQEIQSAEPQVWTDMSGEDCETTMAVLDFAMIAAGKTKSLIIIAQLGNGESSRRLNSHRLRFLVSYPVNGRGFSEKRIVTAQGERVRGAGQVEIYVGGDLHTVFKMKRNKDFTTGCIPAG